MHIIDYFIFAIYMAAILYIGFYFFKRNKNIEDYYVGGRNVPPAHVGLSIVATDVGGGFSIGLGGLGFVMGLSGSWLLFTGLLGAWLSAVFILPKIKKIDKKNNLLTYPDFLRSVYNNRVATLAAVISGIGYLGFTGAQILAGAKLMSATLFEKALFGLTPLEFSLYFIGFIIIAYTVLGGLKAVIYTDTVQWIVLLTGLIFFAMPLTIIKIGGFSSIKAALPAEFFTLTNISAVTFINWLVTIVPIWLIAMTLYQRMFAVKDVKDARKAWYIAGFFEYPIMAFVGVFLGMCGRILFPEADPEMGLPMTIKHVLPIGATGIVIASYFSAIMSTADSCLMASSGNFVNDLYKRHLIRNKPEKHYIKTSQLATLLIGIMAIVLASRFKMVLDAILYAYAFMVSGLFVPTLGAYFWKRRSSIGAFWGMLSGGLLTLLLIILNAELPFGLDATLFGILLSAVVFISVSLLFPDQKGQNHDG
jgi:SSS family solute:Na+ symporter